MANANSPVTMPAGTPLAAPVYLVINDGTVVTTTTGIPVNVVQGTISAENPSVGVLAAAIPADATLLGASDGTNLQQLLVESASNRNLRIALYNGASEVTLTSNSLNVNVTNGNTNGQSTMANSSPVVIASNQGAVAVGATSGTAFDANSGTISANTLRIVAGGSATGTKSNVASSGSSVTILAANTARKGATLYNDSTQICYLDLSGGTASSSSYSLQMPSNSLFELPGPNLYNGLITGIWASANGNMRVTEFS